MEDIKLEIKLLSNAIDRCPNVKISIDDTEYFSGEVLGEHVATFTARVSDKFNLNINFAGNDSRDFILDDQGMPTNSTMITIDSVKLEGIDVTEIVYKNSVYTIDPSEKYVNKYQLEECMDFSFCGVWTVSVQSPVYIWMLENL